MMFLLVTAAAVSSSLAAEAVAPSAPLAALAADDSCAAISIHGSCALNALQFYHRQEECVHVYIYASGKGPVTYIIQPVFDTLIDGFQDFARNGDVCLHSEFFPVSVGIEQKIKELALDSSGIFVWVGASREHEVPWNYLRSRGVYAVYYQSEPVTKCVFENSTVDEMWDFSLFNIEQCGGRFNAPRQRYIPIGAHSTVTAQQLSAISGLVFFGNTRLRPCWRGLKAKFGDQLSAVYSVWTDTDFQRFLNAGAVYLNLHKGCINISKQTVVPITWRNGKLLNAKQLLLSERCYREDEKKFEGLITFVDTADDLLREFEKLRGMTQLERQRLADDRHAEFARRFNPEKLFYEAGIGELLRSRRKLTIT